MENTDGQRKLTSLPESSDDSSQNEQQQGANHGDDRERLSKKTNSTESTQKASGSPRVMFYSDSTIYDDIRPDTKSLPY